MLDNSTENEGQREGDTGDLGQGPGSLAETERSDIHTPEIMTTVQQWRKGILQTHTVTFEHDCGLTERWIQEELPW